MGKKVVPLYFRRLFFFRSLKREFCLWIPSAKKLVRANPKVEKRKKKKKNKKITKPFLQFDTHCQDILFILSHRRKKKNEKKKNSYSK
jgi:hypothetical protein